MQSDLELHCLHVFKGSFLRDKSYKRCAGGEKALFSEETVMWDTQLKPQVHYTWLISLVPLAPSYLEGVTFLCFVYHTMHLFMNCIKL